MSSDYRVMCLTHDPAIVIDRDWNNPEQAIAAALSPAEHPEIAVHEHCNLLVGRFSYPLVEVCCPAGNGAWAHKRHSRPVWLDHDWLRLLAAALSVEGNSTLTWAAKQITQGGCWTPDRVRRLRAEIRLGT